METRQGDRGGRGTGGGGTVHDDLSRDYVGVQQYVTSLVAFSVMYRPSPLGCETRRPCFEQWFVLSFPKIRTFNYESKNIPNRTVNHFFREILLQIWIFFHIFGENFGSELFEHSKIY